jgi:fucose permease
LILITFEIWFSISRIKMTSHSFSAFFEIEKADSTKSSFTITAPPQTHQKDSQVTNVKSTIEPTPTSYELDELQWGHVLSGPSTGPQNPTDNAPEDLERSRPPSPSSGSREATEVVMTLSNPPMNKWRLFASCLMGFSNGLNDSAPGALIPHMQSYYHITYSVVSLIFVVMAVGFIAAAPLNYSLEARLGRGKLYMLAMAFMASGYVVLVCAPPFPVTVLAFFPIGFGFAINLALCNVFCANLANGTTALGALHGSYGIGGTIGPLIATALVSAGARWSLYYVLPLAVVLANLGLAGWSFWDYEKDVPAPLLNELKRTASRLAADGEVSRAKLLKKAFGNRTTLLGAIFIFAYQGAEVSISGWVISFLIKYRGGAPSSVGYVTAGFWGGITLGRFLLSHPAHKIGEKLSVIGLIVGSIAFELLVWLVPNIIGEAIAVSIVGLLLGPIYPCGTAVFSRLLPRNVQMSSLSFISAMGSSGGAVAPFFVGLLSQKLGTVVLHPIVIGLFLVMIVAWLCLPKMRKRKE